ncbi:RNA dependent RNA polymerase-domain-containing protein [Mycena galericulata]|nr:RNA dependent RNA polymerase-domain-containing protein [Mycena galericulata]
MAKVQLLYLPTTSDQFEVTIALAQVLHSDDFRSFAKDAADLSDGSDSSANHRKLNFAVELNQSTVGATRNDGTGILTLPSGEVRSKFLEWVLKRKNHVHVGGKKIKLQRAPFGTRESEALTLSKTPYSIMFKLYALQEALRVDVVQFGFYYRDYPPKPIQDNAPPPCANSPGVAWLRFDYDHKIICIQLGDESTEYLGSNINISFASISKIAIGYDPKPYVCFDTLTPPVLEGIKFHRTLIGDEAIDSRKSKTRIGSLEPGHLRVAPYAQHVRIVLYNDPGRDIIEVFSRLCITAGLPQNILVNFKHPYVLEASKCDFFSAKRLRNLDIAYRKMDWEVAFQIEALLHNIMLHTGEIERLLPQIEKLSREKGSSFVGLFLQEFHRYLRAKSLRESPAACFTRVLELFEPRSLSLQPGAFNCCHVTVTPTRMILEGPYPVQSNRIIRKYHKFEDRFLRVDFRDESRINFNTDGPAKLTGSHFVRERVGGILKKGLVLGGRQFEFLAYSTSALRGHAVWFMNPFKDDTGAWITSEIIRKDVGDFAGTPLLKCPSKYAARLAQAFTATDPSVRISRNQWEEVPDLILHSKYVYTDGVGTISRKLANMIWQALCEARHTTGTNAIQPSAVCQGVVGIDEELDNNAQGILMRLRPSMKKFESDDSMPFEKPNTAYLNRPLVMALEDRGVRQNAFRRLQDGAVAAARTIDDSISQFRFVLRDHSLGNGFRLSFLLQQLENLGMDLQAKHRTPGIDNEFLRQLRQVAMNNVLRDIKHSARIPIPESYLLVGVADEGPAYTRAGYTNVYELPPGKIYACIHRRDDEGPIWLEGSCTISRSPIAHLGDVQRVQAIGKPPEGMLCLFAGLKNCCYITFAGVRMSLTYRIEPRSLASCLGGGDLDYSPLLPPNQEKPASYPDGDTLTLERDSTVDDICDFIVEYINSDVLVCTPSQIVTVILPISGDQSKEGMHDEDCKWLAALCSQGFRSTLDNNRLPKRLIRCNPDWHAAEVVDPRKTDYYRSDKALGDLYRAIEIDDPKPIDSDAGVGPDSIFHKYSDELRYISSTHTVTNAPGIKLLEAEIVVGTILAKCTQKRWRSDCIFRMRYHASTVVRDIQKQILPREKDSDVSPEKLQAGLTRAWSAWDFSLRHETEFGAKSFGLIALGLIFDCLELLKQC